MTEPISAEEVPIEDGDSSEEHNTDAAEETEDENDKLEDFRPSTGWPDPGFPPPGPGLQLDEGVK